MGSSSEDDINRLVEAKPWTSSTGEGSSNQETPTFGFAAQAAFQNFSQELNNTSSFAHELHKLASENKGINGSKGTQRQDFITYFKPQPIVDMKMQQARLAKPPLPQPYSPPSAYKFRGDELEAGSDFKTNFRLPNNQNVRDTTAKDQAGFHQGVNEPLPGIHTYDPKRDGKPEFITKIASSCNPSGIFTDKMNVNKDLERFWEGGQTIKEHEFREETEPKYGPYDTTPKRPC